MRDVETFMPADFKKLRMKMRQHVMDDMFSHMNNAQADVATRYKAKFEAAQASQEKKKKALLRKKGARPVAETLRIGTGASDLKETAAATRRA